VILLFEAFAIDKFLVVHFKYKYGCSTSHKQNIKFLTSDPESTQKTGLGDVSFIMLKLGFNHSIFGNNGFNKTD